MSVDELVMRAQQQLAPLVQQEAARQSRSEREVAEELVDGVLAAVGKDWAGSGQRFLDAREELVVKQAVLAEMFGLGGLDQLLADERIENIDIIGNEPAWLSHDDGRVTRGPRIAATDAEVVQWLQRTAARMGRTEQTINDARPLLNMELPGGERLAAAIGVTDRPHVSIRRHRLPNAGLEELRRRGMISAAQLMLLRAAVRAEKNVVICGRQKAGKTTLLRALCWEIPPAERFATLETEFELGLHRHRDRFPAVIAFEEREGNSERSRNGTLVGGVDLSRLVWQSLRMHTARTVVGEVRGNEIIPMLNALSSGGAGSLSTVHARSAAQAVHRMVLLCLEANTAWTPEFAYELVANTIDLIVHVDLVQQQDRLDRHVAEIVSIEPGEYGKPARTHVFKPGPDGGRGQPTGNLPTDLADYERGGFDRAWLTSSGDGGWSAP
ncbi:CpaF family protein [Amycolatopsis sp. RTGN1]|uniref:CpaF family protein n=1 Tax=Amycolatopsis ponsaeliensis TaxID=2992142 RepID=UPI00254BF053|nr:CpaF/VirB11 family protein [Amycolatopsis sp. RTGN1]